jgi:hypothetical protein
MGWETTLHGLTVGLLVAVAFIGGCFCGSWVQRSIGYVIRTRVDKELLDSAAEREEKSYENRRLGEYQAGRTTSAEEAMANLAQTTPQTPMGPPIPSPDQLDELLDAKQRDWTKNLGTERMKEAVERG